MWFGDLVTMRWFNDVWMKEVFANFMAAKIVNPSFPAINHELRFLLCELPDAPTTSTAPPGTNAIRQPLDNLDEAGTLYGAIIYQKAPIVMRQLERFSARRRSATACASTCSGHSFANATWRISSPLLDAPHARGPRAAGATPGSTKPAARSITTAAARRQRHDRVARVPAVAIRSPRRGLAWTQRLRCWSRRRQVRTLPVTLSARLASTCPAPPACPRLISSLPTGGGIGYGGFVLDDGSRAYLLAHLPEIPIR